MTRSRVLLDTSALLYYFVSLDGATERLGAGRLGQQGELVVASQCLHEFYAVATRPAESRGGLGLPPVQAQRAILGFRSDLLLLEDPPDLFDVWLDLVVRHGVSGRATHDARLAAFALAHEIETVATRDRGRFRRFGLNEIEP